MAIADLVDAHSSVYLDLSQGIQIAMSLLGSTLLVKLGPLLAEYNQDCEGD
jgi:hypothetical protein